MTKQEVYVHPQLGNKNIGIREARRVEGESYYEIFGIACEYQFNEKELLALGFIPKNTDD